MSESAAHMIRLVPVCCPDPAHSSCLGAFGVALSQTCDGKEWYASTRELQLASLQFCAACRGATTLTLRVDRDIPRRLLAAADAPPPNRKKLCRTRVPRLRARRVVWDLPTAAELRTSVYAVAEAREMHFSRKFVESLEGVVWPRCLRILEVHSGALSSDLSMAGVVWPGSLQRLTFGGRFNQPMEEVVFPASLVEVSFGFYFNRSIERISWPAGLRRLKFLFDFNQPIRAVTWPDSMTQLTLGSTFNRPIHGVKWPASLLQLTFGYYFDKPIEGVVWPATLQRLTFGRHFDRPIEGAAWPDSLRQLTFGEGFDQPIGLVRWPASLEDLHIGTLSGFFMRVPGVRMLSDFNHPIGGARWPASLRRLTLGGDFLCSCQRLKSWMPNLEHLTLLPQDRSAYPSLLGGVEWP
ncbi:unnamed protein product, partial [Scytosiphon promiscuus]